MCGGACWWRFRRDQRLFVLSETVAEGRLGGMCDLDAATMSAGARLVDGGSDRRLGLCLVAAPGQERSESIWSRAASGCLEDRFFFGEKRGGGCEVAGPDVHKSQPIQRPREHQQRAQLPGSLQEARR